MNDTYGSYKGFRAQQESLVKLVERSETVLPKLLAPSRLETLHKVGDRVKTEVFRVMVLGEFKRGKSTFINALLGEEILPAFATPCTAVINRIKWGEQKRAVLHFRNPLPARLPASMPAAALEHVRSAQGGPVPPLEIPIEELESYVVIPDPARDQSESIAETPYELVEISWPIELCRNGVEILDSPGLNEHETRTRVTAEYLGRVDAVVFVMSCQALASQSEMHVIERDVRGNGHEDLFLVCNRFDEVRPRDRDRLMAYAREKLAKLTSAGERGIYFVSALDALEGRLDHDPKRVEDSRLPPLEAELARFLTVEKGRVKLLQPARETRQAIGEARKRLPEQRQMLEADLEKLEKAYEEVRPRLEDAQRRREQIRALVHGRRERMCREVRQAARAHLKATAAELPGWVESYEPKNELGLTDVLHMRAKAEALAREVAEHLSARVEDRQADWRKSELEPLISDQLEGLKEAVEVPLKTLLTDLDDIRADLSGVAAARADAPEDASGFERVLAAAGGMLLGGIGSAAVGGAMGFKEMLKSLVPNIAVTIGLVILGVANPLLWIGALFGTGLIQMVLKTGSKTDEIKRKVAMELSRNLSDQADEAAEKISRTLFEKTEALDKAINEGLEREIASVTEQVEAVLAEKRKGEHSVAQKKSELVALEASLGEIESELDNLIFDVLGKPQTACA